MKILRYWKQVQLLPGVTYFLVDKEVTSDQGFFEHVYKAVKESDFDYVVIERTEIAADYRGERK